MLLIHDKPRNDIHILRRYVFVFPITKQPSRKWKNLMSKHFIKYNHNLAS